MPKSSRNRAIKQRLAESIEILELLGFGPRQSNDRAAFVLLALLDLQPSQTWAAASSPLRGVTPIIQFIRKSYDTAYAPNTRETIRDEAVKFFVEAGLLIRNPDKPDRPPNSGKTVYQIEPTALSLLRTYGTKSWPRQLKRYLASRTEIRAELERHRSIARVPVRLPSGAEITLSPGGQNPLIRAVIEDFCPRFVHGGIVTYIGDAESKFLHLEVAYLEGIDVVLAPAP